jgi:hypothetical protein
MEHMRDTSVRKVEWCTHLKDLGFRARDSSSGRCKGYLAILDGSEFLWGG